MTRGMVSFRSAVPLGRLAWLGLALGPLLAACSAGGEVPGQLVVRLYRQSGLAVGPVTVTAAEEGGATGQVTVAAPFVSCSSNRVRVLPAAPTAGRRLTITASAQPGGEVSTIVVLPRAEVELLFGAGAAREPSACGQPVDGGSAGGDAASRRPLGAACESHKQCADGLCLEHVVVVGQSRALPAGYCTRACGDGQDAGGAETCGAAAVCVPERDANQRVIGAYCLARCEDAEACRGGEGYECTLGKNCFPTEG
ncbi:MAG: hypothetical protein IPL40_12540 [Proteobacteria bacterium]|nr:hypothetical protein [Pseudomonadota bacterium]